MLFKHLTIGTIRSTIATRGPAMTRFENTLPPDPLVGSQLGDTYRILRKIGEGGMAAVYEAQHARIDRRFAIKVLHMKVARVPESLARFDREARIGSQLGHDHIVQVFDFNRTDEGSPYLVMELLEGEELSKVLQREENVPVEWAVAVARQVGSALAAAHEHGVVHRDLKPDNIFLCGSPRQHVQAKILDFGLVKVKQSKSIVTGDSAVFGTPWYMSPEQARGKVEQIDHRTDIYALGVVIYRMLARQLPFDGPSIPSVLYRIVHEPPPSLEKLRPGLAGGIYDAVHRSMSKQVDARQASASELLAELEAALGERWNSVLAWCQRPTDRSQRVYWKVEPSEPGGVEALGPTLPEDSDEAAAPTLRESDSPEAGIAPTRPSDRPVPELSATRPPESTSTDVGLHARKRSPAVMVAVTATAALLLGAGAFYLLRSGGERRPAPDSAVAPLAAATPDSAPPPAPPDARAAPDSPAAARSLSVFTEPSGAHLLVDGVAAGVTPVERRSISTDRVQVRINLEGHVPARRTLAGGAGPVVLNVKLRPRPATLNVTCLVGGRPAAADVFIDGRKVDQTPAMVRDLKPGSHRVKVQARGGVAETKALQLAPGQRKRVVFRLGKR
jgi:serine/threonine-protein kinase